MRKRLLAIIATVAMVVAMVPAMAFAETTVHQVDTTNKLTTAVANMKSGDTIKLTNDISMGDSPLSFTKDYDVTLDLNGHTLDGSGKNDIVTVTGADTVLTIKDTSAGGTGLIRSNGAAENCGAVYVKNGKIIIESGTFEGTNNDICYAAYASTKGTLIINGGKFIAKGAGSNYGIAILDSTTLEINGGTITSNGVGISANGNYHNTSITINGGTIEAGHVGIYHPQVGKLTVNDGVIKGKTGIEMRSGELIVNGGTIEGDGPLSVTPNGNGSTTQGAAIAVAQHTTKNEIDVTINGGTFKSDEDGAALNVSNPEKNANVVDDVVVTIDGGLFEGNVTNLELVKDTDDNYVPVDGASEAGTIKVNNGAFKDSYKYVSELAGDNVDIEYKDENGYVEYYGKEAIAEALGNLKEGDNVSVHVYSLEDSSIEVPKGIEVYNWSEEDLTVNGTKFEYVEPANGEELKPIIAPGESAPEQEKVEAPAKPEASPNTGDNNMAPLAAAGLVLAAMAAVVATRRRAN